MKCRICESETEILFKAKVLDKYNVDYRQCSLCEFVQTEEPYWLAEAYSHAFTTTDTGTLKRSYTLGKSAATLLFFAFNRKGRFVDYAGGYGTLARLMRDIGFDFYSTDLYATNFMARGFDAEPGQYELATAIECFEHFVNPREELGKILTYSSNIFFTTQLCPKPAPAVNDWWYYAPFHGQHIALYRRKSLRKLGEQYGLHYYNLLNYHLFTRKKLLPGIFPLLVAAGRLGLVNIVRLLMKSRTLSDSALLEKPITNLPH